MLGKKVFCCQAAPLVPFFPLIIYAIQLSSSQCSQFTVPPLAGVKGTEEAAYTGCIMINCILLEGNQKAQGTFRSFPLALQQPLAAAKSSRQEEALTGGRDSCGRRRVGGVVLGPLPFIRRRLGSRTVPTALR